MKLDINGLDKELKNILTGSNSKVMFQARPVLNQHLNYDVLKYLLGQENANGVMVNLYRSHLYMHTLLQKRKVKANGLRFLDSLYSISGDTRKSNKKAIMVPCPFSNDFEDELFSCISEMERVDFIQIDDIVALQNYWNRERIEDFIDRLSKNISLLGDPPLCIVADSTRDEWVLEAIRSICHTVVEVNGFKLRRVKRIRKK